MSEFGAGRRVPTSRRGRKKQRTRAEIYEAAMRLFAAHGYDAVRVEAICDEADVARATFFTHFPSKSSLLLEFGASMAQHWLDEQPSEATDHTAQLQAFCRLVAAGWFENGAVMVAMLRELLQAPILPPPSDGSHQAARADLSAVSPTPLHAALEDILVAGQAAGEFSSAWPPAVLTDYVLATAAAVMLRSSVAESPDQIVERFLDLILHGLSAPHAAGSCSQRT